MKKTVTPQSKSVDRMIKMLDQYDTVGKKNHNFKGLCYYLDDGKNKSLSYSLIGKILPSSITYIGEIESGLSWFPTSGYTPLRSKVAPLIAEYFRFGFTSAEFDNDDDWKIKQTEEGKKIRRRVRYALKGY